MELVDIRDLKSLAPSGRGGSTPPPGTNRITTLAPAGFYKIPLLFRTTPWSPAKHTSKLNSGMKGEEKAQEQDTCSSEGGLKNYGQVFA